jgi:hypothetical protein
MHKQKYEIVKQDTNTGLKSNNGGSLFIDEDTLSKVSHFGKKEKKCTRLTFCIGGLTGIFLIIMFCFAIGAIVSAYTGFAIGDQKGIWGLTFCVILMLIILIFFITFAVGAQCASGFFKRNLKKIDNGILLIGVIVSTLFFIAIIIGMYFSYCIKYSCEPFNMVKIIVGKNTTLVN